MSSHSNPRIQSFLAGGAIAKGKAVKFGADREHVVAAAGNTDSCIGIAQNAVTTAEDVVEVALPGGGGKGLCKEAITAGKLLVANADGSLEQTNADGDRVIAMAMEDGVENDVIAVEVVVGLATGANK